MNSCVAHRIRSTSLFAAQPKIDCLIVSLVESINISLVIKVT